ncbi:hypothetical protein EDC04DRAFT_2902767 [Pisolithus marmoratus]|nr:hypothetical protein EDC04DRAFT_2902767 [Pisolithus marmoratus]
MTLEHAALDLLPPGHPNHDTSLHDLACNLRMRFEKQATLEDLEEAILQNLALCLSDRYDNLRVVADLQEATTFSCAAQTLHTPKHPDHGTADLDEAIALEQEALWLLAPGDHRYDISQQCLTAHLQTKSEAKQGSTGSHSIQAVLASTPSSPFTTLSILSP